MSTKTKSKAVAIYLFATRDDIAPGLQNAEAERKLKYVQRGSFESANIRIWEKAFDIPDFAVAVNGDSIQEKSFLIVDAEDELKIREVPQRRGGMRYIIDGVANPNSIFFQPGGLFTNLCVVRGELSADPINPTSMELYDFFFKRISKDFIRVKRIYFVGPEPLELSRKRIRLTHSLHAPSEYDLKIED